MSNHMHHKAFALLLSSALLPLPAPVLAAFNGNDRSNISSQLDGSSSSLPFLDLEEEESEWLILCFWLDDDEFNKEWVQKGVILSDVYTPSRHFYIFKGWIDTETNEMVPLDTPVTHSMELKAVWEEAEKVTVQWVDDEGAIRYETQAHPGERVRFDGKAPSKSGYMLNGWKRADTGETISVLEIKEEDRNPIRLVPNWVKYTQWNVEWWDKYDYFLDWARYTMIEGDPYPVLEKPWQYIDYSEVDGFLGWFDQYGNSYEIGQPFNINTPSDITLKPQFDAFHQKKAKVDFYLDEGMNLSYDSREIFQGELLDSIPTPSQYGTQFLYWADAATGVKFDFSKPIESNVSLYAVWKKLPSRTILWLYEDLSIAFSTSALVGSSVRCKEDPYSYDYEHYCLKGWIRSDTGEILGTSDSFTVTDEADSVIIMTPVFESIPEHKTVNIRWLDMRGATKRTQTFTLEDENQTIPIQSPFVYTDNSGFIGWFDAEGNELKEDAVITQESPNTLIYQARFQSIPGRELHTIIMKMKGKVWKFRQFLAGDKVDNYPYQYTHPMESSSFPDYAGFNPIGWVDSSGTIWQLPFQVDDKTPETLELTYMYSPEGHPDIWIEDPESWLENSGTSTNPSEKPGGTTGSNGSVTDDQQRTIIWQKDDTILYVQNLKIGSKVSVFKLANTPDQKFVGWTDSNGKAYSGTFTITEKTPEVLVLSPRWETIVQEEKPDTGNKLPVDLPIQAEPVLPDLPTPAVPTIWPEGWKQAGQRWQYQKSDGTLLKNSWKQWLGRWYHFDENGFMETGWIRQQNNWYHLQNSGAMSTGWVKSGNAWYYLDNSGVMQTGWQKTTWKGQPKWFYFDGSGAMKTGWLKLMWNGKADWYYFQADGTMKANDTLGKYRFDSAGKCLNP